MNFTKPMIDIGLYTNRRQPQLDFWQGEVGLAFDYLGKLGGGVHQLRHHCNGSIIKVNHARDALTSDAPTGLVGLTIAREDLAAPRDLRDPDGNAVRLVPMGEGGLDNLALRLRVRAGAASHDFYSHALGLADLGEGRLGAGRSETRLEAEPGAPRVGPLAGLGLRYFTFQIDDCDGAHARVLAAGGTEGRPPRTLGDVVRYSFVRDPDGNWIELSERASLTDGLIPRDDDTSQRKR